MDDMLKDMFGKARKNVLCDGYNEKDLCYPFKKGSMLNASHIVMQLYSVLTLIGHGLNAKQDGRKDDSSGFFFNAVYILCELSVKLGIEPEELLFEETKSDMLMQLYMDAFNPDMPDESNAMNILVDASAFYNLLMLEKERKEVIHTVRLIWIDVLAIAGTLMSAQSIYYNFNAYLDGLH